MIIQNLVMQERFKKRKVNLKNKNKKGKTSKNRETVLYNIEMFYEAQEDVIN